MKIERFVMGMFATNTYLLTIDNDCILIDPASKAEKLIEILDDKNLVAILLTHGHFDHIKAVDGLVKKYNCPCYISQKDEELIRNKEQGIHFGIPTSAYISVPVNYIDEGIKEISPFKFETIYTPGHTKGSVCYKFEKELFTGDTLFKGSIGRTDLEGGSDKDIRASIKLLKEFPDDINIYPGHEDTSTLEIEKQTNPYLM